jgi:hypothetical protein
VKEEVNRAPSRVVYTILADGKPIVALEANGREATELCKEDWFRSELSALASNGEPLCGSGSKLQSRPAAAEERIMFQEASKEVGVSDEILFVYLVELDGA